MTIALEFPDLTDPNWPTHLVERLLSGLLIDTGGVQFGIRFGVQNVPFTASNTAPAQTVLHGLGRTPVGVWTNYAASAGGTNVVSLPVANITSTSFDIVARATTVFTGTVISYWVVIG